MKSEYSMTRGTKAVAGHSNSPELDCLGVKPGSTTHQHCDQDCEQGTHPSCILVFSSLT